jgi:hypothetical protein
MNLVILGHANSMLGCLGWNFHFEFSTIKVIFEIGEAIYHECNPFKRRNDLWKKL